MALKVEITLTLTTSADFSYYLKEIAFQVRQHGQLKLFFGIKGVVFSNIHKATHHRVVFAIKQKCGG